MNKLMLAGMTCATLLAPQVLAHGGQYRGPGDVVPPGTGPRTGGPGAPGPTTPGPAAPGAPGPGGPTTPGPGAPPPPATGGPGAAGPGGGPKTPRGIQLTQDLGVWQFWWEFNKDPIINLRDAIHGMATTTGSDDYYLGSSVRRDSKNTSKPSESDIQDTILPTIKRALENTENQDINSSCVIALAKIGRNGNDFKILPIFEENLKKGNQEIRETAALAMGLSAMPEALDPLVEVATDGAKGRKLAGQSEIDTRTRAFACYGLGLMAYSNADIDLKAKAFKALDKVLHDKSSERNLQVASINAIGLLKLNTANADEKGKKLLEEALASLDKFYDMKAGKGTDLMKSHVPPAIAKLIGRGTTKVHNHYKDKFLKDLKGTGSKKKGNNIYRACALALGQLARPGDKRPDADYDTKQEKQYSAGLSKYYQNGKDAQARYFCLIALGQIGGNDNKADLLKVLTKGSKAMERPWAAIALGLFNYYQMKADERAAVDITIGERLLKEFKTVKNPDTRGALAVGLGLSKFTDAAGDMMDMLAKTKHQEELAGYLCVGLALMDYTKAKHEIHELVKNSVRRPKLLQQAAIALGKLGDKTVATTLTEMLMDSDDQTLAKLSAIASALGFIGDRRTIEPLKKMLHNDQITNLSRAFAAVALGAVADKEQLPWNSKIARNMNYRGAVETLTQSGTGVLDIL